MTTTTEKIKKEFIDQLTILKESQKAAFGDGEYDNVEKISEQITRILAMLSDFPAEN